MIAPGAADGAMQVRLEIARNKANVKKVVLRSDVVIGRSPECNLRIASNEISRQHCRILLREGRVLVRDLGSSNGTFVDGQRIAAETDVPVAPGARLSIGGVEFLVRYEAGGVAADLPGQTATSDAAPTASAPIHPPVLPVAGGSAADNVAAEVEPLEDPTVAAPFLLTGQRTTETFDFVDVEAADESAAVAEHEESSTEPRTRRRSLFGLFGRQRAAETEEPPFEAPPPVVPAESLEEHSAPASEEVAEFEDEEPAAAAAEGMTTEDVPEPFADAGPQEPASDEDDDLGDFLKQLGQ